MSKKGTGSLSRLAAQAIKARENAYCPYSNHPVGVALLDENGRIFAGANCENANYKSTCAERAAITAMTTAGGRKISLLVVVGPKNGGVITPCGSCRQDIREFADGKTRIHTLNSDGKPGAVYRMEDLLPKSFGPENLKKNKKKK